MRSPITGWMGHAAPFDFVDDYRPAEGMAGFLAARRRFWLAALEAGVDLFSARTSAAVSAKGRRLCSLFIARSRRAAATTALR